MIKGIQDSLPERRNLNMMSMAVIIFSLGGAEFLDGKAKLFLLNVTFHNLSMLAGIFLVMLLWFWFRYYVESYENFLNDYRSDLLSVNVYKEYAACEDIEVDKHNEIRISWSGKNNKYYYTYETGNRAMSNNRSCLENLRYQITAKHFFTKPTISAYLAPYFWLGWP